MAQYFSPRPRSFEDFCPSGIDLQTLPVYNLKNLVNSIQKQITSVGMSTLIRKELFCEIDTRLLRPYIKHYLDDHDLTLKENSQEVVIIQSCREALLQDIYCLDKVLIMESVNDFVKNYTDSYADSLRISLLLPSLYELYLDGNKSDDFRDFIVKQAQNCLSLASEQKRKERKKLFLLAKNR